VTAVPDPQTGVTSSPSPPGLDNLRRLTIHCRRERHAAGEPVHEIGEHLNDREFALGGAVFVRPVRFKCRVCRRRCYVKPLCMGG
jgi:hypothetical protein